MKKGCEERRGETEVDFKGTKKGKGREGEVKGAKGDGARSRLIAVDT